MNSSVEGSVLSVKGKLGFGSNIWKVTFKFKYKDKVIERETLVSGVSTCSGEQGKLAAALAVAESYHGSKIKVLKCEFVGTAVLTGAADAAIRKSHDCKCGAM